MTWPERYTAETGEHAHFPYPPGSNVPRPAYVIWLEAEATRLQALNVGLMERIAAAHEVLAKRAENKPPPGP